MDSLFVILHMQILMNYYWLGLSNSVTITLLWLSKRLWVDDDYKISSCGDTYHDDLNDDIVYIT